MTCILLKSCLISDLFGSFPGMRGHGPSTIPVVIPTSLSGNPQAESGMPVMQQTSSSLASSDAEVAELAGCSIEDSTELKRTALELQTVAKRTTEKSASRDGSEDSPSTEEGILNVQGTSVAEVCH